MLARAATFRVLKTLSSCPGATQLACSSTHASEFSAGSRNTLLVPPPSRTKSLSGTVPYHTSYLLLHTLQPPEKWPSIFLSHLYFVIQRKVKENDGLVNFCWQPSESHEALSQRDHEETYSATFWKISRRNGLARRAEIPMISDNNVEEILGELFSNDHRLDDEAVFEPSFYVCTHAKRDCRCGVRGGKFSESLRKELRDRGMLFDQAGRSRVGEVGHVGGHKNAPNVIVFPQGDWYGNLEPSDIPMLLDHWLKTLKQPPTSGLLDGPNLLQWRGRIGMTKEEQTLIVGDRT